MQEVYTSYAGGSGGSAPGKGRATPGAAPVTGGTGDMGEPAPVLDGPPPPKALLAARPDPNWIERACGAEEVPTSEGDECGPFAYSASGVTTAGFDAPAAGCR